MEISEVVKEVCRKMHPHQVMLMHGRYNTECFLRVASLPIITPGTDIDQAVTAIRRGIDGCSGRNLAAIEIINELLSEIKGWCDSGLLCKYSQYAMDPNCSIAKAIDFVDGGPFVRTDEAGSKYEIVRSDNGLWDASIVMANGSIRGCFGFRNRVAAKQWLNGEYWRDHGVGS